MKLLKMALIASSVLLLTACDKPASQADADDTPLLRVGTSPDGYPHYFVENGQVKALAWISLTRLPIRFIIKFSGSPPIGSACSALWKPEKWIPSVTLPIRRSVAKSMI